MPTTMPKNEIGTKYQLQLLENNLSAKVHQTDGNTLCELKVVFSTLDLIKFFFSSVLFLLILV